MSSIKDAVSGAKGSDNSGMPNSLAPYSAYGFKVILKDILSGEQMGLFQEVSGLSIQVNVTDLVEGCVNDRTHKLLGNATYSNVTLKRGLFNRTFFDWIKSVSRGKVQRQTLEIQILGDDLKPVMTYKCERAVPVKWDGPSLNVMSDAMALETLELAHEGLELVEEGGE